MKKLFIPFISLFLWAITSCTADIDSSAVDINEYDQDFAEWGTDGVPEWLDKGFAAIFDVDIAAKYGLSSNVSVEMYLKIAKVHDIDSRKFISLTEAYGVDRRGYLIEPNREPDNDIVVYEDESTNITTLGRYDIITGCFTPGGERIADKKLCERILSSPGKEIYCLQNGRFAVQYDRVYGLNDIKDWLKPHFENNLRKMCEKRFNEHGTRYFWGTICLNLSVKNDNKFFVLTEEYTNGRGMPFVIETYVTNDDTTLTRYLESFIVAEDGTITTFPFDEIKQIALQYGAVELYNPLWTLSSVKYILYFQ